MRIGRLMLVAAMALGVFATLGTPAAWSAATGGGTVTGQVTTDGIGGCTNGDPLCRKPQNNIKFAGVLITGALVSDNPSDVFVGSVKVGTANEVTAKSTTGATLAEDAGIVNPFSVDDAVSATGNINNGAPPSNGCKGTYQRVGSIVVVPLACKFRINSSPLNGSINVVAQFTPTTGDGITSPITAANFTGVFVGAA